MRDQHSPLRLLVFTLASVVTLLVFSLASFLTTPMVSGQDTDPTAEVTEAPPDLFAPGSAHLPAILGAVGHADRCADFLYWANHLKPDPVRREAVLADVPALVQVPGSPMANKLTRAEAVCTAASCARAARATKSNGPLRGSRRGRACCPTW